MASVSMHIKYVYIDKPIDLQYNFANLIYRLCCVIVNMLAYIVVDRVFDKRPCLIKDYPVDARSQDNVSALSRMSTFTFGM